MEETLGLISHDSIAPKFEAGVCEESMEAGQTDEKRLFFQV